jgi:hypothetical protein
MPIPTPQTYKDIFRPQQAEVPACTLDQQQPALDISVDDRRTEQLAKLGDALGTLLNRRLAETVATNPETESLRGNELLSFVANYRRDVLSKRDSSRAEAGMLDDSLSSDELINASLEAALGMVRSIHKNGMPKKQHGSLDTMNKWDLLAYDNPARIGNLGGLLWDKYVQASARNKYTLRKDAELAFLGVSMLLPYYYVQSMDVQEPKTLKYLSRSFEKIKYAYFGVVMSGEKAKVNNAGIFDLQQLLNNNFSGFDEVFGEVGEYLGAKISEMIADPELLIRMNTGLEGFLAQEEKLEDLNTDWVVLPVGGEADMDKPEEGRPISGTTERFVDKERIKYLRSLAVRWGNGSYVAKGLLRGSGRRSYYVSVLKDTNGLEHAVADCEDGPTDAIFMHRGDNIEGMTWQQVFDGNKNRARTLGARRVKHTGEDRVEGKVLDLLTRPIEQWNDQRYTYE